VTVAGKTEFDRAGTSHKGILGLKTPHGRDADKTSDMPRDRFVTRIGKTELSLDCGCALPQVGHLDSLPAEGIRQTLGAPPSLGAIPGEADQHPRGHSLWQGRRRFAEVKTGLGYRRRGRGAGSAKQQRSAETGLTCGGELDLS
jgi:hypothetical protein